MVKYIVRFHRLGATKLNDLVNDLLIRARVWVAEAWPDKLVIEVGEDANQDQLEPVLRRYLSCGYTVEEEE